MAFLQHTNDPSGHASQKHVRREGAADDGPRGDDGTLPY